MSMFTMIKSKKSKILLTIFLALCIVVTACVSSSDRSAAETLARKEAEDYYYRFLYGSSSDTLVWKGCNAKIKSSDYSNGYFIVNVDLVIEYAPAAYPGATLTGVQPITYQIKVKSGKAEVIDFEYGDFTT